MGLLLAWSGNLLCGWEGSFTHLVQPKLRIGLRPNGALRVRLILASSCQAYQLKCLLVKKKNQHFSFPWDLVGGNVCARHGICCTERIPPYGCSILDRLKTFGVLSFMIIVFLSCAG